MKPNVTGVMVLVAPSGTGKTATLQEVHERTAAPLINVNLELSRRMLDLTERQRVLQMPRLLAKIVGACATDVVLLDNVEVLRCLAQTEATKTFERTLAE